MKVILLQNVPSLGKAGDVKNVADGHARNFLIPRGLAKPASTGEVKQIEQHKRSAINRSLRELHGDQALAARLSEIKLTFKAHAGEGTKLYGSITSADIAEQLSKQLGQEFDRRKIQLDVPLRQLGVHQVPIRLRADVTAEVTVIIEREGESPSQTE